MGAGSGSILSHGGEMAFEQPVELNPFVYPVDPLSPGRLWISVKVMLPVLLMAIVMGVEARSRRGLPIFPGVYITLVIVPVVLGLTWASHRWEMRRKRALKLNGDFLEIGALERRQIPWANVDCFIIEPAGRLDELKRLTIKYSKPKPGRWPIVIADARQYETVLAELKWRQKTGSEKFTIEIFRSPATSRKLPEVKMGGFWCAYLGMFLFFNAMPMLSGHWPMGARNGGPGSDDRESQIRLAGGVLLASAMASFSFGVFLLNQAAKARKNEELGDERILPPGS